MANPTINQAFSAEQLLLAKMESMQVRAQPDFVVSANPLDGQSLNPPLSFASSMQQVLDSVNQHQAIASQKVTAVETGQSDDLVGAMIASQKASLSFDALMQVRNKLVTSFDDIMKMPV
ncbi:flagellar hook-basal body complex protein FliE [Vibrio sp.]|uniref:flagellar hook-basal body complex protein FliE n=1 Tax=Vibrio sp. TaxID=678 RepID=UPI003D1169EA